VARFDDYADAQRAVDRLSDDGFPVEQLDIIGSELQLVERITGRLTKTRSAAAGAVGGMWIGLLIGVLFRAVHHRARLARRDRDRSRHGRGVGRGLRVRSSPGEPWQAGFQFPARAVGVQV
jgi:hypothetical protein